jgi:hypothetical protein
VVQGKVRWPQARITVTLHGSSRVIHTSDLPVNGTTGTFPISPSSAAYRFDAIRTRSSPRTTSSSSRATPRPHDSQAASGSADRGAHQRVLLFDALDEVGRDAVAHEIQDSCDGHPQQGGIYHDYLRPCFSGASLAWGVGGPAAVCESRRRLHTAAA